MCFFITKLPEMHNNLLDKYLDKEGKVKIYPSKRKYKILVLEYIASKFEISKNYTEAEINNILNQYHTFGDWALLRRELFEAGFLGRNGNCSVYWKISNSSRHYDSIT